MWRKKNLLQTEGKNQRETTQKSVGKPNTMNIQITDGKIWQ